MKSYSISLPKCGRKGCSVKMVQPFRAGEALMVYESTCWPGLAFRYDREQHHIRMLAPEPLQTLSSAPYAGGSTVADHIVNVYVTKDYNRPDPIQHLESEIMAWGYPLDQTVGLLTAAKLTHASIAEAEGDQARIVVCTTAGTSNAARAGRARETFAAYAPGTINTIVAVDGRLAPAALVGAIITATEAKAAALQDLGITDPQDGDVATGTTTDTVVLAVSQSARYGAEHQYAGSATTLGNLLGRLVYNTVYEAARTQGEA